MAKDLKPENPNREVNPRPDPDPPPSGPCSARIPRVIKVTHSFIGRYSWEEALAAILLNHLDVEKTA